MTAPVRMAIVGLGWWGQKMVSVLQGAAAEIELLRGVEPDLAAVQEFAAAKGLAVTADYADALADPAVEAVVLATPHDLHEAQIAAAVAAGKHIFCEKPLALTRQGAARAVQACADAGLQLGMGHERRWEPPIADLLARADAGDLGRIQQVEANFSHDKFLRLDPSNWRLQSHQAPAGGMTATGIHLLDLSVRLLGAAAETTVHCENLSSGLPQGDTIAAFTRFAGGGTSYVSASLANPFFSRFAVFGSLGWIDIRDKAHVESPDGWVVTTGLKGQPITVADVPKAEPVRDNLVAFARAVRAGGGYPITGAQMVDTIALLEAVFASARTGLTQSVSSGDPA